MSYDPRAQRAVPGSASNVSAAGRVPGRPAHDRRTEDRILPYQATAARLPGLISDVKLVTVEAARPTAPGPTRMRSARAGVPHPLNPQDLTVCDAAEAANVAVGAHRPGSEGDNHVDQNASGGRDGRSRGERHGVLELVFRRRRGER